MPIRIGLQPAAQPRLRVDWWNASKQAATSLIKSVQLTADRLVRTPFRWALRVAGDFRGRFSLRNRVRRRQFALLCAFDDRYEQLVALICCAAQSTGSTSRDGYYKELRKWMRDNYGSIRHYLQPAWANTQSQISRDPFESLLAFERLEEVLTAHSSIEDMMLCRNSLDKYRFGLEKDQKVR